MTVKTRHRKNADGEQVTQRIVILEDAVGSTTRYPFEETANGHEYVGDGEPSDRALEVLEATLEG